MQNIEGIERGKGKPTLVTVEKLSAVLDEEPSNISDSEVLSSPRKKPFFNWRACFPARPERIPGNTFRGSDHSSEEVSVSAGLVGLYHLVGRCQLFCLAEDNKKAALMDGFQAAFKNHLKRL